MYVESRTITDERGSNGLLTSSLSALNFVRGAFANPLAYLRRRADFIRFGSPVDR